jgi:hypothetical protein
VPKVRNQAETYAEDKIQEYFRVVGSLLERTSGLALSKIQAVPTTMGRSYFNNLTRTLAIGIPAVVYSTKDSAYNLDVLQMLRLIGHEGMGHALNNLASQDVTGVPFFLGRHSSLTEGTAESVAQHFEEEIFDDIEASLEAQRELGIDGNFPALHQEVKDARLLEAYQWRFFQYALTVLADKSLSEAGSPNTNGALKKKHEAIVGVALSPDDAGSIIDGNIHSFDRAGNLSPALASEMRYAAQPVQRALNIFFEAGLTDKPLINRTLLTGYWTPEGFIENAKVIATNPKVN